MNFEQAFFDELEKIARDDRPGIISSTAKGAAKGAVYGTGIGALAGGVPSLLALNPVLGGVAVPAGAASGLGFGTAIGAGLGAVKGVRNKILNALDY